MGPLRRLKYHLTNLFQRHHALLQRGQPFEVLFMRMDGYK